MPTRNPLKRTKREFPALEWLGEASGVQVRLFTVGANRALIENHTGIMEFTPERIRLKTRTGVLELTGTNLSLTEVRPDALTVRGTITTIALPAAREDNAHA